MSIQERILHLIKYESITPASFAKKIGVSSQRFGNYLKDRDPDYETLRKICETFIYISPQWLLMGEGPMLKNSYGTHNITVTGKEHTVSGNNIGSGAYIINSDKNNSEIELLQQKIDFLEKTIKEKDKMLEEKEKLIAEKERLINVLLNK